MIETKEIYDSLLNERILESQLDNGLKVFLMPRKGYTKQYAIFATKYGSIDSKFSVAGVPTEVPDGIAHFLEHKLFEEPEGSIFDQFSELGSNVNAYTNFTSTCYLFSSTDRFYENLELLIRFVQTPYFTDENVEKEKGIIEQEINMYKDNPQWKVFFNALGAIYHNHPAKIDIAGTVDSIRRITKEDLYNCYHTFYSPKNMIVFIVGDIDCEKTLSVMNKHINNESSIGTEDIHRMYPKEPDNILKNLIEEKLDVSIPLFNIAFKDTDNGFKGYRLLKKDVSTKILIDMLFGKSSDLYSELYEAGLINDTFQQEYTGEVDYGYSMLGGESKSPEIVFEKIKFYLNRIKTEGLKESDFERIKRKQIGEHLSYYNSVEFIATTFVAYYFKDINILDYIKELKSIDFETIQKRFVEHFDTERCCLSIIRPK